MKRSTLNSSTPLPPPAALRPASKEVMVSLVWLMVIGGIAFFWGLASVGLMDETEPLFAKHLVRWSRRATG